MKNTNWFSISLFFFFFFFWNASFQWVPVKALHGNAGRLHLHKVGHANLRTLFGDYQFVENFFKHLLQDDGRSLSHKDRKRMLTTETFSPETTIDSLTTSTGVTTTTFIPPSTTSSQTTTPTGYHCYSPDISSDGVIIPESDQTWNVGSVHNITCLVNPDTGFTFRDVSLSLGINLPPLPHQVVDNYTITTTLNASEPGNYKLFCSSNSSGDFQLLCMRSVIVGYAPLDVENLVCVSWNWNVLQCNWTLPNNPAQLPSEDYKVFLETSIHKIPCDSKPEGCAENCCEWRVPAYQPADEYFIISFSVQNQLGSASFNHTFNNREIIIPDAPKDIVLKTTNGSLNVDVQWKMPVYMSTLAGLYGILSAVEYRPDPGKYGNDTWMLGKSFICRSSVCNATINVEHPGATYEVRVRIRARRTNFTYEDDGWWSNWTAVKVLIPPQPPWNPPTLGTGTFQASVGSEVGRRDISVTWRPRPPLEHNGPDLIYVVSATANGQTLSNYSITDTYVSYKDIYDDSLVRVEVTASNIMGPCNYSSEIEIFPTQKLPPVPVLPVVIFYSSTQQYELIWGIADNATYEFTVYVCTDGMDSKEPCKDDLYWISTGNMTSANVTLQDFGLSGLSNKDIRFALSAETAAGGISSGMSWDGCLSPQNYRATSSPPVIGKSILTTTTSATFSWELNCEYRAAVVEGVIVEWCHGSHNFSTPCESPETKMETDVFSGQIVLTELEAGTQYSVRLRLQYREKLSSWSEHKVFTTVNNPGMAGWLIFIISLGCIISSVLLVLCSTYVRGKIKSMLQDFNSPINVPQGMGYEDGVRRNSQGSSKDLPALLTGKYTSEYFASEEDIPEGTQMPNMQRSYTRALNIDASTLQVNGGRSLEEEYLPGSSEEAENLLQKNSSSVTSNGSSSPGSSRQLPRDSAYVQADFPFEKALTLDSADKSGSVHHSSSLPSRGYMSLQHSEQAMMPINGYVRHHIPDITHTGVSDANQESYKHNHELSVNKLRAFNHLRSPLPNAESGYISSECINKSFSENEGENKNTNDSFVPSATLPGNNGYVQIDNSTGGHPLQSQQQVKNALISSGSLSSPAPEDSHQQSPKNSAYVQAEFPFEKIIAMTSTSESVSKPHPSTHPSKEYMALQHSEGIKKQSNGYVLQNYTDFADTRVSNSNQEINKDMYELSVYGSLSTDQDAATIPNAENGYGSSQCINKLYSEKKNGKDSNDTSVSSMRLPKDSGYVQLDHSSGDQPLQQQLTSRDTESRLNTGNLLPVTSEDLASRKTSENGFGITQNSEASRKQKVFTKNDNGYAENPLPVDVFDQEKDNIPRETFPTQRRHEATFVQTKPASGYVTAEGFSDSQDLFAGKNGSNDNSWDKVDVVNKSSCNGGAVYTNPANPVSSKIGQSGYLIDLSANQPFTYNAEAESEFQPSLPLFILKEPRGKDGYVSLPEEAAEASVTGSPDSGISNSDENLRRLEAFEKVTAGEVSKYEKSDSDVQRETQTFKMGNITSTDLPPGYCRVSDVQT